jgi:hypothetical protein
MPYTSASVQAKVIKNTITVFDGNFDACDNKKKKKDLMKVAMAMFGIPFKCPVKKNQLFCFNGTKITQIAEPTKRFLPLLFSDGKDSTVMIIVTHDSGSSCFQAEINVK